MADTDRVLLFHSDAYPDDPFQIVTLQGHEAISRIFRFEIELVSPKGEVNFNDLVTLPATLSVKHGVPIAGSDKRSWETLKIGGVLSSFEQLEKGHWVRYRAVLVPLLWRLSLNVQSQVHQKQSVPKIIEDELKKSGFTTSDYEFRLSGERTYPEREYTVQYLESDLNFIQRLAEHEGIFYFFEHKDGKTKVVFGDHPGAFRTIQGPTKIEYRPSGTLGSGLQPDWFEPEVVQALSCRQNVIPSGVLLRDYNFRTPTDDLQVEQPVDTRGAFGTFYEYGNHYKDKTEGADYAKIRAQELKCRKKLFIGKGDARAFRAGACFTLAKHYRGDFNQDYLLSEVWHEAAQAVEHASWGPSAPYYRNDFVSVPASETFRPERVTPKPRVWTLNATVDGPADDTAQIDSDGRYKVKVPFDKTDLGDGSASRYVRLLNPHAGPGEGFHAPLRKNTEVVLTHMNGDPDRPLIEGAVCNPRTPSVVNNTNNTQFVWKSYSNNIITFENRSGEERICLESPKWKSFVCIGNKDDGGPDGIRACTEHGISINAGKGVNVTAGASDHNTGLGSFNDQAGKVGSLIATVVAAVSAASALTAEKIATGHAGLGAIIAEAAGFVGGLMLPSCYVSAPGKVAVLGGAEVVIGANATIDVAALGPVNVLSPMGTLVAGGISSSVVAGGDVECVSVLKDVKLHAKLKDVKIHAKKDVLIQADVKNVKIEAKKMDIVMEAERNWHVGTHGKAEIMIKKDIYIDSTDDKKIVLKAGKSMMTMDDNGVTIEAPGITFLANEKRVKYNMGKAAGSYDIDVDTEGVIEYKSKCDIQFRSKKSVVLDAKDDITLLAKLLDALGCNKDKFKDHTDNA